jgi:foldase protein PrsA
MHRIGLAQRTIRALLLGLALLCLGGLDACAAGESSEVVAQIGSSAVSKRAIDHWARLEAEVPGKASSRPTVARQQALRLLVAAAWIEAEAHAQGLSVSQVQVEHRLNLFKFERLEGLKTETVPREAELGDLLVSPRATPADQQMLMRLDLLVALIEHLHRSQASQRISRAEIAEYYERHRRRFFLSERRDYNIVETYTEPPILEAARALRAGQSFRAVAKRLSVAPEAPGALRSDFVRGDGSKLLEARIFAARPHMIIGPLKVALYYIFEVVRAVPSREESLAEAEASIRRELAAKLASSALAVSFARHWSARTRCQATNWPGKCAPTILAKEAASGESGIAL